MFEIDSVIEDLYLLNCPFRLSVVRHIGPTTPNGPHITFYEFMYQTFKHEINEISIKDFNNPNFNIEIEWYRYDVTLTYKIFITENTVYDVSTFK